MAVIKNTTIFLILILNIIFFSSCKNESSKNSTYKKQHNIYYSYETEYDEDGYKESGIDEYGNAQNVYKTPSGKKYHLSSCRMVENVSKKLLGNEDISKYNLTPCKICKPPSTNNYVRSYSSSNKAVGTSLSVRCKGYTRKGTRCKHKTRLANGYCYQHTKQNSYARTKYSSSSNRTSSTCGARTNSGGYCKRKVKGGGHCYQH